MQIIGSWEVIDGEKFGRNRFKITWTTCTGMWGWLRLLNYSVKFAKSKLKKHKITNPIASIRRKLISNTIVFLFVVLRENDHQYLFFFEERGKTDEEFLQ